MRIRRLAVGAATGLLTIALSACGGSSDNSSDKGGSDGSGSSSSSNATLTAANFGTSVSAAVKDAKSVHIDGNVTASGSTFKLSADTAFAGKSTSMQMSMNAGQLGNIQMVLADRVIYIKSPQLSQLSKDPGKPWVKIDVSDPNSQFAKSFDKIFDQADPSSLGSTFKGVKSLKKVGTETVQGVKTTHYIATIDTAAAIKAAGGDPSMLQSAGVPKTTETNVWLDSQNRPVEVKLSEGTVSDVDLTFTKWGQNVSIAVPPASQVGELANN